MSGTQKWINAYHEAEAENADLRRQLEEAREERNSLLRRIDRAIRGIEAGSLVRAKIALTEIEHGKPTSDSSIGSIFELVDCTNHETYIPMGLFLTLEDALDQVRDRNEPPTDDPEEFVEMEVRERQLGKLRWRDNGKTVATIQWIADYIESKDEWIWHKPTISTPNKEISEQGQR